MVLYFIKEGDTMGTSTRRTNEKVRNIINNNKVSSNGEGIDKIISEALFPKNNKSKIKNDVINSTCSTSFTKTIKKIIDFSMLISNGSISIAGIGNFNSLSEHEKIEVIVNEICYDEDPIIRQSILDILNTHDINNYLGNSYLVIKDFLNEFYTEKFEIQMFEELATNLEDFDDEQCKIKIKKLVETEINKVFTYPQYQQLVISINDETALQKAVRNISSLIIRGLKV